ncbi:MAG TPA: DUF2171 domain-containing protein [Meiothermus sp.]|jgi:hypothetical protein|nr:DUF2171 domain-containing protein [Meiothermus sp.]
MAEPFSEPYLSSDIREHMAVYAGGEQVGTVDHLDGTYLKLTRRDSPDGAHHWVPLQWVERVDTANGVIYLIPDAEVVRREWHDLSPNIEHPLG